MMKMYGNMLCCKGGVNMPTIEKVTYLQQNEDFCLTDCGPSDGCNPDDDFRPTNKEDF